MTSEEMATYALAMGLVFLIGFLLGTMNGPVEDDKHR
jgi:hypothetical protein